MGRMFGDLDSGPLRLRAGSAEACRVNSPHARRMRSPRRSDESAAAVRDNYSHAAASDLFQDFV